MSSLDNHAHDHSFGQAQRKAGESRTLIVIGVTLLTMAIEIAAGIGYGSMALLADGMHMGSHASALTISAFAYFYTRRHANDPRFNFGTGKVNFLGAFASAVILAVFAMAMAGESAGRLLFPVPIEFNQAILVALLGLAVNGASLVILNSGRDGHPAGHASEDGAHGRGHLHVDHNLLSAYLHVLADALTSILAVAALLAGKYLDWLWLDPVMGMAGAMLVMNWSWGLMVSSSRILLDMNAPGDLMSSTRAAIESAGDCRVADLHIWAVGPGIYAAEVTVVSMMFMEAEELKKHVPADTGIAHITVETRRISSVPLDL